MSFNHDAVAAIPISGNADKALIRSVVTKRMAYVLADADDVTNLVAVDPATGAAIIDILFLGRVFHYDSTDTTTANDGVSCLVSFEGRRYKLSSSSDVFAFSVLDNTHSAPPGSPAIGDAYLIAAAATGAWVGKSNFVTVWTRRGWEFINFGVGRMIYVRAIDTYYHKNAAGTWVPGLGASLFSAGSVPITAVLGANASFVIKVENQTTNTPPGSPTAPTAYIIGPAPTGAWAGNTGKLAMCLVAGSFTIITPVVGDTVYDKAQNNSYTFNGTAWVSTAGVWVNLQRVFTAGTGSASFQTFTAPYSYVAGTAPTTAKRRMADGITLSYTAKKTGALLRFHYSADVTYQTGGSGVGAGDLVVGLFRDAETDAIEWQLLPMAVVTLLLQAKIAATAALKTHVDHWFEISASDALSHSYSIALTSTYTDANNLCDCTGLSRRLLEVEESGL